MKGMIRLPFYVKLCTLGWKFSLVIGRGVHNLQIINSKFCSES